MREPSPARSRPSRANPRPSRSHAGKGIASPRVALFRAAADAESSAARLRRLGFSVARLPVIETRPLPVAPRQARYDAVIATSDKAFHAGVSCDTSSPLYAVGARTGHAGEARGWRLAAPAALDADALAERLVTALKPQASVLYLAGRDRKPILEERLSAAFALEIVEAYAAEARSAWRPAEARGLTACVAALHYSRRSAELAAEMARAAGVEACFLELKHVCMSRDAAKPLETRDASRIAIAETPDEAGLFRTLRDELGGFPSSRRSRI